MAFALYQDRVVAPLKNVAYPLASSIERVGIAAIQLAHTPRQMSEQRFHQQVVVITHLAPSVDTLPESGHDASDQCIEKYPVAVVNESVSRSWPCAVT